MSRLTIRVYNGLDEIYFEVPSDREGAYEILDIAKYSFVEEMKAILQNIADKLAEYEDLEEQGKLIKLPCFVGDVVYTIEKRRNNHGTHDKVIVEHTVIAFVYEGAPFLFMQITGDNENERINGRLVHIDAIGSLVFLTQAEAKAKLKELRESDEKC